MDSESKTSKPTSSLQRALWRGCSIIAPPLVTLLLLIWIASAVEQYVLLPLETATRTVLVWTTADILDEIPQGASYVDAEDPTKGFNYEGTTYVQPPIGKSFLPRNVIGKVDANLDRLPSAMQSASFCGRIIITATLSCYTCRGGSRSHCCYWSCSVCFTLWGVSWLPEWGDCSSISLSE